MSRPRIDLDGVALHADGNPHMVVAIFRYRTTDGLVLLIPESADVVVPWPKVKRASLDLASGDVAVELDEAYVRGENWLRGATKLVGKWMDRYVKT